MSSCARDRSFSSQINVSARKEKYCHGTNFALGDFISVLVSGPPVCRNTDLLSHLVSILSLSRGQILPLIAVDAVSKAEVSVSDDIPACPDLSPYLERERSTNFP